MRVRGRKVLEWLKTDLLYTYGMFNSVVKIKRRKFKRKVQTTTMLMS